MLERHRPDFVVIGAMKSATSTLHDQLAAQPGTYLSTPKEPNFFSDDEVFARGFGWYASLFAAAPAGAVRGESSTHYTKRPVHPHALERMRAVLPDVRLIYVMRDPVARLRSQFVHEWTEGRCGDAIVEAVERLPELVDYSRYAMQLRPWLEAYGPERILPVFQERLRADPQAEFARVVRHLGLDPACRWQESLGDRNVGAARLRRSPLRDLVVGAPGLAWLRRTFVPQGLRDRIKRRWQMATPPEMPEALREDLVRRLDPEVAELGRWLGRELDCASWRERIVEGSVDWDLAAVPRPAAGRAA